MFSNIRHRALSVLAAAAISCSLQAEEVDPALPAYTPVTGLSGNLNSVGSDTLEPLMKLWSESFVKLYPDVKFTLESKGSGTAPAALTSGQAQLGPMSREMKSSEADKFLVKKGYSPSAIGVSVDALALFVHKDNPVKGLNLQQVDSLFSQSLKRGGATIDNWGGLALTGDWAAKAVALQGRDSKSGTHLFFQENALKKGEFKASTTSHSDNPALIAAIAKNPAAIGYSAISTATADVRALPLAINGTDYIEPTQVNCLKGTYPLSRMLFIYVDKNPEKAINPVVGEFIRFVLSKDGQSLASKHGFFSLSEAVAATYRDALK